MISVVDFIREGRELNFAILMQLAKTREEYQATRVYNDFITQIVYYLDVGDANFVNQMRLLPVVQPILGDIKALTTIDTTELFNTFRTVAIMFYSKIRTENTLPLDKHEHILREATPVSLVILSTPQAF